MYFHCHRSFSRENEIEISRGKNMAKDDFGRILYLHKKDINIHSTRQMKKLLIISKKEAKRKCGDNIVTYVKRFHEIFNKESVLINGRTTYM